MINDEFLNLSVCIIMILGFNILVESIDIKDKRNLIVKNDRLCVNIKLYIFLYLEGILVSINFMLKSNIFFFWEIFKINWFIRLLGVNFDVIELLSDMNGCYILVIWNNLE